MKKQGYIIWWLLCTILPGSGWSQDAMFRACELGDTLVIRKLILQGADVNYVIRQDSAGHCKEHHDESECHHQYDRPPLFWVVLRGHHPAAGLLIGYRADPNIRCTMGTTPLHWACLRGDTLMVRMLLDAGAVPDVADDNKQTPAAWALKKPGNEAVIVLLTGYMSGKNAVKP